MTELSRRSLIAGSFGAGLALPSMARAIEGCGDQPVVHIMAGTNDIAQNTGPMSPEDSKNNFMAMCEIARAHGIRVVLGATYADYAAALTDANGNVKLSLAKDEVHPTAEGYAAMRPIAEAAISGKR